MKRHGSPVVNGELRYLSVSAVEKAKMCLRRHWYHYVMKIEEEGTDAQARGRSIHAEIEKYLTTGERPMSADVLAGMHMIPSPGDDLLVEHDLAPDTLETAVLRADGIPFIGAIDLMHARGTNEGTMDIEEMFDAGNTITVGDWKSCRTLRYIKLGPELVETTQMSGYAKYAFDAVPEAEQVRLFHGYFPVQGLPRKTTAVVDREQVEQSWKRTVVLARSIRDAVRETNPDLIDANTESCRAFGRDCPARKVCNAGAQGSLAGAIARMNTGACMSTVIPPNGLLSRLTKKPAETAPAPAAIAAPPALTPEQIAAERERLSLLDLVADIDAVGLGFPTLAGDAATVVSKARKQAYSGVGLAGTGELAEFTISEVADLEQVLVEARSIAASRAAEAAAGPPEVVSADAPEPTVPLKYDSSAPAAEPSPLDAMAAKADAPKKRGRKPKTVIAPVEAVSDTTPEAVPEPVVPEPTTPIAKLKPEPAGKIDLYIDCSTSFPTTSLWPIVNVIVEQMHAESGTGDFRLSEDWQGKWRGVLAHNLRINVVPGVYSLDGAAGEIAQVVTETLRTIVDQSGGVYVRGAR